MRFCFLLLLIISSVAGKTQELYVFTEPASNMAAKSMGIRMGAKALKMTHDNKYSAYRYEPEIMVGVSKNLMLHLNMYASDMFQSKTRLEGASFYAKWRFLSIDDVHSHFRMAVFGKVSVISNPNYYTHVALHKIPDGNGGIVIHQVPEYTLNKEIELDGTNSGINAGVVATKLVNKLAVSSSFSYSYRLNNLKDNRSLLVPWRAFNYSLSAGYLVLPKEYTSYKQTNVNLYTELLTSNTWDNKAYYIDVAPAVQFIFNSIAKVDIGYRTQLRGTMLRMCTSSFLLRVEYNLLNIFSKKK